jgi:hypothetical protein
VTNFEHARALNRLPAAAALSAALLVAVAACSDDPFSFDWDDTPDTVFLHSLARPELNLYSGFNFQSGVPVRIEAADATGRWDVAVDTEGSNLVFVVPGYFGVNSTARISVVTGSTLDQVTRAPTDSTEYAAVGEGVPIQAGSVYVFKTNRSQGSFGRSCLYYAKAEPLTVDVAGGALTFRYVTNPICNDPDLVPPD